MLEKFDWLLSNYRWFRKRRGGHWECWTLNIPVGTVWEQREHGTRPPCGMGTPICEDWNGTTTMTIMRKDGAIRQVAVNPDSLESIGRFLDAFDEKDT
jgi:hypothetical protein